MRKIQGIYTPVHSSGFNLSLSGMLVLIPTTVLDILSGIGQIYERLVSSGIVKYMAFSLSIKVYYPCLVTKDSMTYGD